MIRSTSEMSRSIPPSDQVIRRVVGSVEMDVHGCGTFMALSRTGQTVSGLVTLGDQQERRVGGSGAAHVDATVCAAAAGAVGGGR